MATVISSKDQDLKARRTTKKSARKTEAPSEDEIRILAYTLYEQRSADGGDGDAASDWIEAERRLSSAD